MATGKSGDGACSWVRAGAARMCRASRQRRARPAARRGGGAARATARLRRATGGLSSVRRRIAAISARRRGGHVLADSPVSALAARPSAGGRGVGGTQSAQRGEACSATAAALVCAGCVAACELVAATRIRKKPQEDRPERDAVRARPDPLGGPSGRPAALDLDQARERRRGDGATGDLDRAPGRRRGKRGGGRRRSAVGVRGAPRPAGGRILERRALGIEVQWLVGVVPSGLDRRRERPSPGSVWSKRPRERAGRLEVQSRSSISGSESAASRVKRRSSETSRRRRRVRGVQRRRRLGAAGTATLDRLTDVLDVGPPCLGLAVWHALSVLFPGLTGLADGLALKESRYAEGDSPQ